LRGGAFDPAEVVQLIRAVARTEIMPRCRNLRPGDVQVKSGPHDLITTANEQTERRLANGLARLFPGCVVVGEEAASRDPGLVGAIADAELCFVVDPIDGTANFCAGLPLFGIMVVMVRRGAVVAAVIHDPVGDDTALAVAGQGAWLESASGERVPLRVALPVPVADMAGAVSWRYMPEPLRSTVCRNLPRVGAAWDYRCAAHQYRMLAAGHCHYVVFHRLLPWDHAAGWLLHQEAGGWSARLDGSAYRPAHATGGLICTPDEASWHMLRAALMEG
jgi:fructose-1,6-bisphosphatase/inositol monophosphatase family enzyme